MEKNYLQFIAELKRNIVQSRYIAARLANREQLLLYFKTGKMLSEKIAAEKWGARVLGQIAEDLQKQLPGLRGFSQRNLVNMRHFYATYQSLAITQSATAQIRKVRRKKGDKIEGILSNAAEFKEHFWGISFTHHILILNKCTSIEERVFYITQAATQFWSVSILEHYIESNLFSQQGKLPNNFSKTLPEELKPSALKVFQDEYLMDFISSGGEEFFIDLLFFNRHLQCLVAFELKRGKFKPEYAGQLNFYLNVLDEKIKLPNENPSIGIVLCKEKNNTVVEFAVKTIDKAMGVATYRTTKEVPREMKGILPNTDDLVKLL